MRLSVPPWALFALRAALALVFLSAGTLKLGGIWTPQHHEGTLLYAAVGSSTALVAVVAFLEIVLGTALLFGSQVRLAACGAMVVVLVGIVLMLREPAGSARPCGCFGALESRSPGAAERTKVLLRAGIVGASALMLIAASPSQKATSEAGPNAAEA